MNRKENSTRAYYFEFSVEKVDLTFNYRNNVSREIDAYARLIHQKYIFISYAKQKLYFFHTLYIDIILCNEMIGLTVKHAAIYT